ncbi:MAG: hypothetical protein AAF799_04310 [Myxococcota bacterium]
MIARRTSAPKTLVSRCFTVGLGLGLLGACQEPVFEVTEESVAEWMLLECDPLAPSYCGFPFPSNVYTVVDESTATGRRLQLGLDLMPEDYFGLKPSPGPWNRADGFSASSAIMTHFPGLTQSSLRDSDVPTFANIDRSMEFDSPTILVDAESGERVPHWVELDATAGSDDHRTLLIRPATRLDDGRRYVVAIRRLVDDEGESLMPSEAFEALRDGLPSNDASVRGRRALYTNIFNLLETGDVLRHDLQIAWDFTTASRENNTAWMLDMRDTAMALVGSQGPEYRITVVDQDWENDTVAVRLVGQMEVPLFLTEGGPGGHLVFDSDGDPLPNPEAPWGWFPFEIIIPQSVSDQSPGALLQYGHGLLGNRTQVEAAHLLSFANDYGYVLFSVDMLGMMTDDQPYLGAIAEEGRFDDFSSLTDRQHQGMINSLLAMRMMTGGFSQDADYGRFVDPSRAYYHGSGQGGNFGATYMALTTDVERGVLGVTGQPYNLLLSRAEDFDGFFSNLRTRFSDQRDVWMLQGLMQMLWDRTEAAGYSRHIREDTLPGSPAHQVLLRAARGDHQVSILGAQTMARAIGTTQLDTGLGEVWGLDSSAGPIEGSAYVEYDFGVPPDPTTNEPQRLCEDPHERLRWVGAAREQMDAYLRNGRAESFCGGACVFEDVVDCEGK